MLSTGDAESDADDSEDEDEQRRRRAIILLVVLFVFVLFAGGAIAFGVVSFGGTGELTVSVTDQNGNAASGQEVQVVDPDTGEVIATGTTDDEGEVDFNLDQGDYEVVVGDKSRNVELGADTTVDVTVDTTPPEPNRDDFFNQRPQKPGPQ